MFYLFSEIKSGKHRHQTFLLMKRETKNTSISISSTEDDSHVFVMYSLNNETPRTLTKHILDEDDTFTSFQKTFTKEQIEIFMTATVNYLVKYNKQLNMNGIILKAGSRLRKGTAFYFPRKLIEHISGKMDFLPISNHSKITFSSLSSINSVGKESENQKKLNDLPLEGYSQQYFSSGSVSGGRITVNSNPEEKIRRIQMFDNDPHQQQILSEIQSIRVSVSLLFERFHDVLKEIKILRDEVKIQKKSHQSSSFYQEF